LESRLVFAKRYLVYLGRWQLSTPVMAPVTLLLGATVLGAVAANLVGGLIFFWVDRLIFGSDKSGLAKKYLFYLGRWQLTSITLYPCLLFFGSGFEGVIAGNFFGAIIFFWVDKYIFANRLVPTYWEIVEKVVCADCGSVGRGYRIVRAKGYDRTKDKHPEFRCEECSKKKTEELVARGVQVRGNGAKST